MAITSEFPIYILCRQYLDFRTNNVGCCEACFNRRMGLLIVFSAEQESVFVASTRSVAILGKVFTFPDCFFWLETCQEAKKWLNTYLWRILSCVIQWWCSGIFCHKQFTATWKRCWNRKKENCLCGLWVVNLNVLMGSIVIHNRDPYGNNVVFQNHPYTIKY